MPQRNLLRVAEHDSLWRVLPLERAVKLFHTRQNVLVRPSKWDDPFENVLARCRSYLPDGRPVLLGGLTEKFFGQCWTNAESESDATWRIYTPSPQRGVRIRVNAGKLFDTIYDPLVPQSAISCFLGAIRYLTETELRDWLSNVRISQDLLDPTGLAIAETLLVKRTQFQHEAEVRLLYSAPEHSTEQFRLFTCDPLSLVEHILLDPRWTDDEAGTAEAQLRCFGYNGPVQRSTLYSVPDLPALGF